MFEFPHHLHQIPCSSCHHKRTEGQVSVPTALRYLKCMCPKVATKQSLPDLQAVCAVTFSVEKVVFINF